MSMRTESRRAAALEEGSARPRRAAALLAASCCAALALAGCGSGAPDAAPGVVVTEVDGVLRVELGSLAPPGAPRWETREVYTTMAPGTGVELFRVTAARFLAGGELAIANAGAHEILVLGAAGAVARRIGREGSGPGEFRWISALDVDGADDLLAYDPREGRLTRFSPQGDVLETRSLAPPNRIVDLQPLAFLDGGRVLAVYGQQRIFAAGGEARDTTPLLLFDSTGAAPDTLGLWPAQEWSFIRLTGGTSRTVVGFGRTVAYAGGRGRAALGSTDSLDMTVYGEAGRPVMRITGGGPAVEVSAAAVERWREELLASRSGAPEEFRRTLAETPHRPTYPAFGDLLVDDAGRVWIGAYVRPGQAEQDWLIVGSSGSIEGTLTLPGDAKLLDASGDRLALLRRSELDEQYVVVLRIERP